MASFPLLRFLINHPIWTSSNLINRHCLRNKQKKNRSQSGKYFKAELVATQSNSTCWVCMGVHCILLEPEPNFNTSGSYIYICTHLGAKHELKKLKERKKLWGFSFLYSFTQISDFTWTLFHQRVAFKLYYMLRNERDFKTNIFLLLFLNL